MFERSVEIAPDNPLASETLQKTQQLLQLRGLENIPTYSLEPEALTEAVDKLQNEVNQLQAQVEIEEATERELSAARNLAWETYSTLALKSKELTVASAVTGTEVRFVAPALEPWRKVRPQRLRNTALAGIAGFMLAFGAALLIEFLQAEPTVSQSESEPA